MGQNQSWSDDILDDEWDTFESVAEVEDGECSTKTPRGKKSRHHVCARKKLERYFERRLLAENLRDGFDD